MTTKTHHRVLGRVKASALAFVLLAASAAIVLVGPHISSGSTSMTPNAYTVQQGETYTVIAGKLGITASALAVANGQAVNATLSSGRILFYYPPTGLPTTTLAPTTTVAPTTTLAPTTTTQPTSTTVGSTTTVPSGALRLLPGQTWNWQISSTPTAADIAIVGTSGPRMIDVDMENSSAATIAAIKAQGIVAICYIETGSWENYRSDAAAYPAAVLGSTMGGYPDERYVDIRQISVLRPIIDARLDRAKAKGCDGIEPDIDDSYFESTGFPLTMADQVAFNRQIAADAHSHGMLILLKNGADPAFVPAMEPYVDAALNEQCNQYAECAPYAIFIQHSKAVFQVEYSVAATTFCPKDNAAGFDGLKKSTSLSALPRTAC